jgi:hypothetical protein
MASQELLRHPGNGGLIVQPNYPASMRSQQREILNIRNAEIIFRNFAGRATQYNAEGDRNFSVILDEELAKDMEAGGWNVKALRNQDDDGADQLYQLPVAVSFKTRPPRIYMVTGDGDRFPMRKTMLPQDMLYMMDQLDLSMCNIAVTGYNWTMGGKSGKKAYLEAFFGHVRQTELEQEYASVEDMMAEDAEQHPVIEGEVVD